MSLAYELDLPSEVQEQSPTCLILEDVRKMSDPNEQFLALERYSRYSQCQLPNPEELSEADVSELVDFASDPDASPSLLVRAQALELAVEAALMKTAEQDTNQPGLLNDLCRIIPEELRIGDLTDSDVVRGVLSSPDPARDYLIATLLAEWDGINHNYVLPAVGATFPEPTPTAIVHFLDHLDVVQRTSHVLLLSNIAKLTPLALDIDRLTSKRFIDIDYYNNRELTQDARLISESIARDPGDTNGNRKSLVGLYVVASSLGNIFPNQYAIEVQDSVLSLITSALYALDAHQKNDSQTSVELPRMGAGDGWALELTGDQPKELVNTLAAAIATLCTTIESTDTFTTLESDPTKDEFYRYRFWNKNGQALPVAAHIRPYGSRSFDSNIEYGRDGEGVEATINFMVASTLEEGEQIELGKHVGAEPDERISIRLDREGVNHMEHGSSLDRDPTRDQGTVSLDVGAVIGGDNWQSTKIARLLGLGNMIRSNQLGQTVRLNHVIHYLKLEHGRADVFAANAEQVIAKLEAKRKAK